MKDLLVAGFSDTTVEVGEGGLTGDGIIANAGEAAEVSTAEGIVQNMAKILDGSHSFEVAKQVEKEKGDRIVAGAPEDGIGSGCNGADEGEIDNGSDQLRDAAANGAVVIDLDEVLSKFVMGKPAGLFLGKGIRVTAVDERIDFAELSDKIANREAGGFAHLKGPGVSREKLPPSKQLPGTPFLFVHTHHSIAPNQTKASDCSVSTNAGGSALRSFSCA
jgi:hypothetical protein